MDDKNTDDYERMMEELKVALEVDLHLLVSEHDRIVEKYGFEQDFCKTAMELDIVKFKKEV